MDCKIPALKCELYKAYKRSSFQKEKKKKNKIHFLGQKMVMRSTNKTKFLTFVFVQCINKRK